MRARAATGGPTARTESPLNRMVGEPRAALSQLLKPEHNLWPPGIDNTIAKRNQRDYCSLKQTDFSFDSVAASLDNSIMWRF